MERCKAQWDWIIERLKTDPDADIEDLKVEHMDRFHPRCDGVLAECWFCEYNKHHKKVGDEDCASCPGRLIDPAIRGVWCEQSAYHFSYRPHAFYAKLCSLYKKWEAKQ